MNGAYMQIQYVGRLWSESIVQLLTNCGLNNIGMNGFRREKIREQIPRSVEVGRWSQVMIAKGFSRSQQILMYSRYAYRLDTPLYTYLSTSICIDTLSYTYLSTYMHLYMHMKFISENYKFDNWPPSPSVEEEIPFRVTRNHSSDMG